MMALRIISIAGLLVLALAAPPAFARDVSFVEPGSAGGGTPLEAFKVEPKSEIDMGDSIINIVRRQTLFFVNQTTQPIKIEKVGVSSDSTVSAQIVNDDCSKQTTIPALSRCSIEMTVTPIGPGSWGIELLITHDGPGRITRVKIGGKTAGSDSSDRKERGLFLSNKDVKPIDFGDVAIGSGKIVRTALMVNDSPSTITLYSIDVIEADSTLQHINEGCSVDMELKPGESCPVTLVWAPTTTGLVSTDLIIRHSGQLGFAVIPIRGAAKVGENGEGRSVDSSPRSSSRNETPAPPTPAQILSEATKSAAAVDPSIFGGRSLTSSLHLIGTVGNRAVFLKPDGTTAIVQGGDSLDLGNRNPAKVENIGAASAVLLIDGKQQTFNIEAVQELRDKAAASRRESGGELHRAESRR